MRIISLLFLLLTATLSAAEKQVPKPPATNQTVKPKYRPFHGTIKSFDKTARAVTLNGPKAQTFLLISETKINKDGKPAAVEALVSGETVGGRARQAADGRWEALTLNLGKKPADTAKAQPPVPAKPK